MKAIIELDVPDYQIGQEVSIYFKDTMMIKAIVQEPCEDELISRQAVLDLAKKGVLVSNGNYESVCKAINEIPSVNLMPCEDAISRQAVLASIKNLYPDIPVMDIFGARRKWLEKYAPYFECENAIEQLPPVTPQPKTGHWILKRTFPTKLYDEYLNEYKCSECYREIRCTDSQLVNYPYCHCGARMIEPQESERTL